MILFITMAGNPQLDPERYRLPTYLLPWGDRSVLAAVVGELQKAGGIQDVVLIANERDEEYAPHIRATLRALSVDKKNLYFIPTTSGQAATAAAGLALYETAHGPVRSPLLFHNVDTIVRGRSVATIASAFASAQGYVDVFRANHHKYSYVLLDANKRVSEIAEKIVISDTATSGLYGFASVEAFRGHYDKAADKHISSVYRRMLANNVPVMAGDVHSEADTIVVGTPDDYLNASVLLGAT